jgi:predicted transcriptional regulator
MEALREVGQPMINEHFEQVMLHCGDSLIIPKESCVTVREANTLLHALLLLSNAKHSEIPVLDDQQHIVGKINMPLIMKAIKTETEYVWDRLGEITIAEAMDQELGKARLPLRLEDVLHGLVDNKFVALEDENQIFQGIVTRREILSRLNFIAHEMGHYYDIMPQVAALEKFQYPDGVEIKIDQDYKRS